MKALCFIIIVGFCTMKTLDQCTVRRYVKYTLWFYVLIWWLLILKQILVNIDQELIEKYELDLIDHLYGDKVESLWISITTPVHPEQDVHILQTKNFTSEKPDIVLIHGYGATSALAWRNTINGLSKTYDVLAIDLPGFGRSPGSDLLLSSSIDEAFNHYCHFFEEIFSNRDIYSPYVVAHSIGAFIFVRCASRNPDLVSRLLLANVPGLFSSNGAYDYMWATFFTMGLPHNALRICGPLEFSRYIMDTVLSVLNIDIHDLILQYWHLVQLNVHMQSDAIVRKFIRHRGVYALGVGVGLPLLLNLTKPVSLLYGELDPIAPLHQGEYIQSISGIKAYVIDDVSHVPYNSNGGDDFLHVIEKAYDEAIAPTHSTGAQLEVNAISNQLLSSCLFEKLHHWAWYPCLPLPPFLSNFFWHHGIYPSINRIGANCV